MIKIKSPPKLYAPNVCAQKAFAVMYFYQYHQSRVFWMRQLQEMIKAQEESHFYGISLCLTKSVPVMVKPKSNIEVLCPLWNEYRSLPRSKPWFIFAGLDDLINKTSVEVFCIGSTKSYTLPVGLLELDLEYDYRSLLVGSF